MISLNLQEALSYLNSDEVSESQLLSADSFNKLKQKNGKGSEWLGWRSILETPNDALLENIERLAHRIRQEADVFIVCGIGGSYLGAKAVIDALIDQRTGKKVEIRYAGHNMSGTYQTRLINYISQPKADGTKKSVFLNVISKSGTTIEPALSFRVLRNWMISAYGEEDTKQRISCTTSSSGGALNKVIEANNYKKFIIPDDVGGRFSVLTPVGLLPIAVAGIDIKSLYYGAVSAFQAFEKNPAKVLNYASIRYALYKKGFKIDIIASFEPELSGIGGWLQQLLGESEGKSKKGLYPAVHSYSTDLHSLGQMVQDGERTMIETFLTVKNPSVNLTVPSDYDDFEGLNFVAGKTFHEINTMAFLGTKEAHVEGGVPILAIELNKIDAETIGELLYFFELACAIYVYNLDSNPFDQPGVEGYKKAMYRLLGK